VLLSAARKGGGRFTETAKGGAVVEIRGALGMGWTMSVENGVELGATRQQRVAAIPRRSAV